MPNLITNPASHRAHIVAEAVVSAYIHDIAQPLNRGVRNDRVATPRTITSGSSGARPRRRASAPVPARRHALELAA